MSLQPEFYLLSDGRSAPTLTGGVTWIFPTSVVDATIASAFAQSIAQFENDILDYSAQVSQSNTGSFASIICEEETVNATNVPAGNGVQGGGQLATACTNSNRVF